MLPKNATIRFNMPFLSEIGLGIIVSSWVIQLLHLYKGQKEIHPHFIGIYIVGTVVLIIGGRDRGLDFAAILNIASAILATLIFLKIRRN